nr:MAG TPA: hypothetical protein [Caudoviricetes sp.]
MFTCYFVAEISCILLLFLLDYSFIIGSWLSRA